MKIPKPSTQDYIIKLTKGALGAIPFAGSLLGELLEMFIIPQQQNKTQEWFAHVEQTLEEIIGKGGVSKEDIFNDETFTSIFQKTSRVYVNNVEAHKKPLLQSYLKASITKPLPLDKKYIYLDIIDKLTESQLLILKDVYDNEQNKDYKYRKSLEKLLADKYTEADESYLQLLIKGLQDYHLLNYESAHVVIDNENQWHMMTSNIAKDFFQFLTAE